MARILNELGIQPEFRTILYQDRLPGFSECTTEAYMAIDGLIWDGKLVPGQRLVESDLSTELDLQRGHIREALRLLAADGIVELTPNKGARLRRLSPKELVYVTELLNGLFCMSVDIVINQRPPLNKTQQMQLESATVAIEEALDSGGLAALAARYIEYHVMINCMSENPYLNQILSKMHLSIYHRELIRSLTQPMITQAPPVYRKVTEAILSHNFKNARKALDSTLEFVKKSLTD